MHAEARKDALRAGALRAREGRRRHDRLAGDAARTAHALDFLADRTPGTAALYASLPDEPDTAALIDALVVSEWRVLLPVLRREVDWAAFEGWGEMAAGWSGIAQPTGPRLGAAALAEADVVLIPALAVGRDGGRLGTGGGWYDRALPHRRAGALVLALVSDDEVLAEVPLLPHDVGIDGWITPSGTTLVGGGRPSDDDSGATGR